MVSVEQTNLIEEKIINTRPELWDNLFLFVDFSRLKEDYPNMWSKEYRLLPLPKPYQETKEKFTKYCQELNNQVERLLDSWKGYFEKEIYPVLASPEGDKTLLFRSQRLLKSKVIGESSLLCLDLIIWEVEYRQVRKFKEYLPRLRDIRFLEERVNELWQADLDKMEPGRINYAVSWRFWNKWGGKIESQELVEEVDAYLRDWQKGKGAESEWKEKLEEFKKERDDLFNLGSESISDGKPFFTLGAIKKDTEQGLEVACQNRKGFSLGNPFLRVVWLHQGIFRVYIITSYGYIDPRRLYVSLKLREDWVWKDYPWIVNSMGSLRSGEHAFYRDSGLNKLHYSFCEDLGAKKSIDVIWSENINFSLFKIKQIVGGGGRDIPDTEIFIPGFYEVKKVGMDFWSSLTEKEYQTFIAPADYNQDGDLFYVREKQVKFDLLEMAQKVDETEREEARQARIKATQEFLKVWKDYPHLIEHATFQFYFLNNSLFTANLPYLRINDNNQIEVDWKVRATPSGTYVFFRSGKIFFKWKIEVRQSIVNMNLVKVMIDGVNKLIGSARQAVGSFFGIDTSGTDEAKKEMAKDLVGRDRGKDFMERERINRVQEQHTARMFQSTLAHTGDQTIEPAIFYANTVKFPYNLFDYWLRNEKSPFFCRIHYSNNLLNNLIHNNNKNPITYPLDITFEKLGNILKPGCWKGELTLDYDSGGKMTECFIQSVTFYEDKKKHFVKPNLGVKEIPDLIKYSATGGNSYLGQAIPASEEYTNTIDRTKGSNFHQRAHFFITFEDGSKDHWLVLFPQSFQDSDLAEGHSHGGFDIKFTLDSTISTGFFPFFQQVEHSFFSDIYINFYNQNFFWNPSFYL